jgi:hypothetical protein
MVICGSGPNLVSELSRSKRCSIPDVCIDERRLPFFTVRATLRELIAGLEARAIGGRAMILSLHKNATTTPGDPGEDRGERGTGGGAGRALRGDARHHQFLAGADQL